MSPGARVFRSTVLKLGGGGDTGFRFCDRIPDKSTLRVADSTLAYSSENTVCRAKEP